MEKETEYIGIRGAKSHNLKNVSLSIPRNEFVVITGLSGSGKSSLAFDTIYAEGQRRYMDTLSAYAKQFMGILEKPEVESITGLSPIIAIEQKTTGNNPRSTVGTITEIYDFLRLLYSKASRAYSSATGKEMVRYTDEQIVSLIMENYEGKKCYLLAPLVRGRKGHYKELFEQLRRRGYTQVRVDGELKDLSEITMVDRYKPHFIELIIDRLKPAVKDAKRIRDSVMSALNLGKGSLAVLDQESGELHHYSKHLVCPDTGLSLSEPQPHSFSFNSPQGYCPHCKGLGKIVDINIDTIIPDRKVSIADGGIVPLGKVRETKKFDIIRSIARKYNFSLYDPIEEIPDEVVSLIIFGSDELFRVGEGGMSEMVSYGGIVDDISDKIVCPVCHGTRLNQETSYFRIDGKTISEVAAMEISDLKEWLFSLEGKFDKRENLIARDILKELKERVGFLLDVGLEYLSLDRATGSLSGGESQRIRLATQIGSKLVNVLYILDEPSIGLHQRDNRKLIASLKKLRDEGNSVMVVEHDIETMLSADWLVDVGPGAGEEGGRICLSAPLELLLGKGGGSAYGGEWKPSKPDDGRFIGEPGSINRTTDRSGNLRETMIGADGRAVKERHYSDHGSPKQHSIPHDHNISWEGNRPNWGKAENYWDGDIPDFKSYWRCDMSYHILKSQNSLEDNRFKSISDFKWCMKCGGEVEIEWNGIHYGIIRYGTDDKITIYVWNRPETECCFDTADDALEYMVGSDRLRDVITRVTVLDRTI